MTDIHGPLPEDHQGEHEQDAQPLEHEAWQGEQPPDDDFKDNEHVDTLGTMPAEDLDHQADMSPSSSAKKRSIVMPVAVAVGGLIFLGAILYWQFGGMAHPNTSPLAQMATTKPISDIPSGNIAGAGVSPTTGMTTAPAGAAFSPSQPGGTATPGAAPTPTSIPQMPMQDTAAAPIPAHTPVPASIAAPTASTAATGILAAPTTPTAPQIAAQAPAPLPVPVAAQAPVSVAILAPASVSNPTDEARIAALAARVEDLQKTLDQTTQTLSQVNAKLSSNTSTSNGVANAAVEDRLNKVEQQVLQIEHTAPVAAASDQAMPPMLGTADTASTKIAMRSTSHVKHKPHHHAPAAVAHHKKPSAPTSLWVLRAATPDQAWVAKSPTTPELHAIKVGDTLTGVGRVTSIEQDGDIWVVKGTKGSVR